MKMLTGNRVLTTKIHPPQIHGPVITRPLLRQRLISGFTQCSFTLVAATAGYGKTTFVMDGISHLKQKAVWLSLDENDNDPVRFMLYLTMPCKQSSPKSVRLPSVYWKTPKLPVPRS